jgi:hypothetical protein
VGKRPSGSEREPEASPAGGLRRRALLVVTLCFGSVGLVAGLTTCAVRSHQRSRAAAEVAEELALLEAEGLSVDLADLDPAPKRSVQDACSANELPPLEEALQDVLWDYTTPTSLVGHDGRPRTVSLLPEQRSALERSLRDFPPFPRATLAVADRQHPVASVPWKQRRVVDLAACASGGLRSSQT